MLYFLKQTATHSFWLNSLLPAKTLSTFDQYWFLMWRFYYVDPLTLTSFKTRDVTLKYARFLKIGILALDQKKTICMEVWIRAVDSGRPVKLKPISRGISSFRFLQFYIQKLDSQIICMPIRVPMSKYAYKCKHRWKAMFCLIHFSVNLLKAWICQ